MYLILSRNNPYLEELNKNPQGQTLQKDFDDGMEIDLKNRFKSKKLDINNNYNLSNISSENNSEEVDTSYMSSLSFISSKLKTSQISELNVAGKIKKENKIYQLKKYIHILDIISSLIIIISEIFCQIENENFSEFNEYTRVIGSIIINNLYKKPDVTWNEIFSESNINLTLNLEDNGNSLSTIIYHYLKNNFTYSNITNYDILEAFDLNQNTFNFDNSLTNYKKIDLNLKISESDNLLRYIILSLSFIAGLFLAGSRYISFYREYRIIKDTGIPFYKSRFCLILFFEALFLLLFQYPSLNTILIFGQLDCILVLPFSSLLSSFSTFRFLYIFQFINSFSIWDSILSEKILDKYYLSTNIIFTMKAYQKNNPFISLIFLFLLSCVCFALCIRIYEIHYWESQKLILQNWKYRWNSIWCVFVSMTTVGYGDFFPKTHFSRILIIVSCIIGIYFVSMMMIFMTQKSILTENEQKSYKLITRLKIRNQLKDIHSNIIYHALKMNIISCNFKKNIIQEKKFEMEYNYQKRCIISIIDENKILSEKIKSFDIIPTKDQLFDIAERIDFAIKEIKCEVNILQKMNFSFLGYTDTQVIIIKYLKKCIQNTKLMFDLIEKKPKIFGDLSKVNKKLIMEKMNKIYDEHSKGCDNMEKMNLNSNLKLSKLFEDQKTNNNHISINYDEYFSDELQKYQVSVDEFKQFFQPLFFDNNEQATKALKKNGLKTIKTIKTMKEIKKKVDTIIMQRRNDTINNPITEQNIEDDLE